MALSGPGSAACAARGAEARTPAPPADGRDAAALRHSSSRRRACVRGEQVARRPQTEPRRWGTASCRPLREGAAGKSWKSIPPEWNPLSVPSGAAATGAHAAAIAVLVLDRPLADPSGERSGSRFLPGTRLAAISPTGGDRAGPRLRPAGFRSALPRCRGIPFVNRSGADRGRRGARSGCLRARHAHGRRGRAPKAQGD